MVGVAFAQGADERRDPLLGHAGQLSDAGVGEVAQVAVQVAGVGVERVAGDAALDGQVGQVLAQHGGQ